MCITSAGNVGIGTSSPSVRLHVDGDIWMDAAGATRLKITHTGGGEAQIDNPTAALRFATGSTERARIDSSGNVGIGTSAPTDTGAYGKALDVQGSGGSAIYVRSTTSPSTNYGYVGFTSGAGNLDIWNNPAGAIRFYNNGSERARIDSSGRLLVATTNNFGNGGQVCIESQNNANGLNVKSGASSYAIVSYATSGFHIYFTETGGGTVGNISSNGSSTSYNTSSDYRLKEDWVAVADASTRVNALKPVNFAWKVDGKRVDGFLAHELAEVVPEAVTGEKDAVDAKGNPVYQGIDQAKLVPLLTAALQEALVKIESLTARVSALEGN